jgi:EF hand
MFDLRRRDFITLVGGAAARRPRGRLRRGRSSRRCGSAKGHRVRPSKEVIEMISRRTAVLNVLVIGSVLGAGLPAFAEARRPTAIQKFDTDNDGTLDLNEVKKAGGALFDKLDRDHDSTLDRRELRGRLSAKEFAAADPDKDGTLTKDEYLAAVEQSFKAADPDNDGTLDAKELSTPAGRALLRLLQ